MEYKFEKNKMDLQVLREFCEREGEAVEYRKGDRLEREGDPARWFAFVTDGCFKYVNHSSDDKALIKREPSSSLGMAEREEARPKVKALIKREPSSSLGMAECEEARPKVKALIKREPLHNA